MAAPERIPEPSELVYQPRPSWAPAFLALGVSLMVCGIFAEGFIVRGWIYAIFGAVFFLAALISMVGRSVRDFNSLPRRQRVRGAALPAASLRVARRD
ncbi:MAG: hypothetical protein U0R52_00685 [Solirubrobacterales bacterium]